LIFFKIQVPTILKKQDYQLIFVGPCDLILTEDKYELMLYVIVCKQVQASVVGHCAYNLTKDKYELMLYDPMSKVLN
jgi:hypothetical protein